MRVHLNISSTTHQTIPFDHQQLLTGTIHKWLGQNKEHGNVSMYSFSTLENGKPKVNGLLFESSCFFFSSYDDILIKRIIRGVREDPSMFYDLHVTDVIIEENPDLSEKELFFLASPILIKRRVGIKEDHILFDDPRANACLKETLITKMDKAGIQDPTLEIRFQENYPYARYKLIKYNGIHNKASLCPVVIHGQPLTKQFIWNVGLGNSTGIGFGAIK